MKFDAKIRSIFVLEDKTIAFFRGRKQPNLINKGKKIKLPDWKYWKVVSTIYLVNKNEIKRIRACPITKRTSLQVVTIEGYPKDNEKPFVFRLEKTY